MKNFLTNPWMARVLGAAGAGVPAYWQTHDVKTAALTSFSFLLYGATHATAQAANDDPTKP